MVSPYLPSEDGWTWKTPRTHWLEIDCQYPSYNSLLAYRSPFAEKKKQTQHCTISYFEGRIINSPALLSTRHIYSYPGVSRKEALHTYIHTSHTHLPVFRSSLLAQNLWDPAAPIVSTVLGTTHMRVVTKDWAIILAALPCQVFHYHKAGKGKMYLFLSSDNQCDHWPRTSLRTQSVLPLEPEWTKEPEWHYVILRIDTKHYLDPSKKRCMCTRHGPALNSRRRRRIRTTPGYRVQQ